MGPWLEPTGDRMGPIRAYVIAQVVEGVGLTTRHTEILVDAIAEKLDPTRRPPVDSPRSPAWTATEPLREALALLRPPPQDEPPSYLLSWAG